MMDDQIAAILDVNRAALIESVTRLTDEQSRTRLVPSQTTPITLVKHCAAAERVWFQRTVARLGQNDCDGYAVGDDRGRIVDPGQTLPDVVAEFEAAQRSRHIAKHPNPTDRFHREA